jgi:hypothetical protein
MDAASHYMIRPRFIILALVFPLAAHTLKPDLTVRAQQHYFAQ